MFGSRILSRDEGRRRAARPRNRDLAAIVLLGVAILCTARIGHAQVLYGSIVGTVTDGTGALVPNAAVKVVQTETNLVRETTTDSEGGYKVTTLPAGIYNVTVSGTGFSTQILDHVAVVANGDVRADATLKLGTATLSVTVNDEQQDLQTDRAEVRTELTSKEITDIPLSGRNFQSLLATVPGNTPPYDEPGMGSVNNPSRSIAFSGNGTSTTNSNVAIEGVSASNSWIQELSSYVPAQDSIQNVDIVSGSFNAEQGSAGGVSVNVQLKSGSNAFHGTGFEQYTGSKLTALPRFNSPTRNPQLVEHQFGGTIGGPVIKNKLFFFFSTERLEDHETQVNAFTAPTVEATQGYFSNEIFDPKTGAADGSGRTPFPTVTNPAGCVGCNAGTYYYVNPNRWDPATTIYNKNFAALFNNNPHFNASLQGNGVYNNYEAIGPYKYDSTKYDAKVDFNFTEQLHLNYRLSLLPFTEDVPAAFGNNSPLSGAPVSYTGQPGETTGNVISNSLGGVYTFTPKLVLDANVGYTYLQTGFSPPFYGQNYGEDTLGIPNADGPDPINSGVPQFQLDGYFPWFGTWYSAIKNHDPNHTIQANLTWVKGNHNMRFGMNYGKVDLNHAQAVQAYSYFQFNGQATESNGVAVGNNQENTFADFLLGEVNQVQKAILNNTYATLRTAGSDYYAQDQWVVNKKLTVNYGVRWNYFPVPVRDHHGIETFDIPTNTSLVCGRGNEPIDCGSTVSKTLFSPLAGVAYRFDQKTVVRVGGGINYAQDSMFRDGLLNPPAVFTYAQSTNSGYIPYQTVDNGPQSLVPGAVSNGNPDGLPILAKPNPNAASNVLPAGVVPGLTLPTGAYKRGYTESWNLTVEREIVPTWSAQVAYVGTQVVHGQTDININQASTMGTYNATNGSITPAANPYANDLAGNDSIEEPFPALHSSYNSLQSTLRHTFANGYLLTANYTWSRHIGVNGPSFIVPAYEYLNRGVLGDDRTNNFNLTGVGELPFGKGKMWAKSGVAAAIVGGFQINTVLTATSGTPFTVSANANFGSSGFGTNYADKNKSGSPKTAKTINGQGDVQYFSPTYYADPNTDCNIGFQCPPRFGNSGVNSLRGPGLFNMDAGLSRKFGIGERVSLKLQVDAFNATNTPHFSNPSSNINGGNFGIITGVSPFGGRFTLDQRQVRLGAHLDF